MQSLSGIDNILKEVYEGPVRDQLNSETRLLDLFTRRQVQSWEGRVIIEPLRVGRNEGVMATVEDGLLPTAGRQQYAKFQVPIRYLHGRISITAQAIKHSKSNRGSFIRALSEEIKNLVSDLADDRNRILTGFGRGVLCRVAVDPGTGTTLEVKDPGGFLGSVNGTRFLQPLQYIAFIDPSSGTIRQINRIASIVNDTTVTLESAAASAIAVNDFVVRGSAAGSLQASSFDVEPMGLLGIVDDGTYVATFHGISRSAFGGVVRSTVVPNVGAFSVDALYRAFHQAANVGRSKPNVLLCGSDTLLEYIKLTEADRRYIQADLKRPDAGVIQAGVSVADPMVFGSIPFKWDKDFPFGTVVGVDTSELKRYVLVEGEWVDEDGAILERDPNKDNFEGRYRVWENFHTCKPNAHFRLDGITTTVPTYHVL